MHSSIFRRVSPRALCIFCAAVIRCLMEEKERRSKGRAARKRTVRGATISDMTTVAPGMLVFDGFDCTLLITEVVRSMRGFADVRGALVHSAAFIDFNAVISMKIFAWQLVSE